MGKINVSAEEKIRTVQDILGCKESLQHAADRLSLHKSSVNAWVCNYRSFGSEAFIRTGKLHYSKDLKEQAVLAYLNGTGSLRDICVRLKIKSRTQLQKWIKKYNGHEVLKSCGTGETVIMTKGKKTTFDERIDIVQYCIAHDHNYAETAVKYGISYQQARNYTLKYESGGVDALQDRRGKRKPEDALTEVEKLRAELKLERAQRQKAEMEISFLKKLEEIERRRG